MLCQKHDRDQETNTKPCCYIDVVYIRKNSTGTVFLLYFFCSFYL